ncbi:hypothetical protein [Alteribacillus sp. YIM 98480]|uniref:hypothetical protein n=1 Tax=Alteribacillus sp. YIM 98480 TaxID=2606599 RepID=UPI00131AFAC4|nr:hypothetical protein [Alteribacillus sp. YIM 98480]
MSSLLHEKLQDILQTSIDTHQFDRAEQAVSYMRQLARIEAFIAGEPFQSSAASVSASVQQDKIENSPKDLLSPAADYASIQNINDHQRKPDNLMLYYIEEDNLLKFKKPPQTYAVSVEFFRKFLNNLESWKGKDPFSSKTFYEAFANDLQTFTTYQSSTLRQFITLLFRYCHKLDVLMKPRPPQRSRYYVNDALNTEEVIEDIVNQRILTL